MLRDGILNVSIETYIFYNNHERQLFFVYRCYEHSSRFCIDYSIVGTSNVTKEVHSG